MSTRSSHNDPLYGTIEQTAVQVGRFGLGLLRLPLGLLPAQSRTHMERALYELSRGFASLPGDFARIAEQEINRWANEPSSPLPTRHPEPEQHLTVIITPEALAASSPSPASQVDGEPVEEDIAELLTEEVAGSITEIERLVAEPPNVSITYIEYDPPGSDLEGEFVVITNQSHEPVELTGWTLVDEGSQRTYTFPSFTLAGGAEVKVWTKVGIDDTYNVYWGSRQPIWNNTTDSAVLRDANGNLISRYTYAAGTS